MIGECKTEVCRALRMQFGAITAAWEQISEIANEISDPKVTSILREQAIKQIASGQVSELICVIVDSLEAEAEQSKAKV